MFKQRLQPVTLVWVSAILVLLLAAAAASWASRVAEQRVAQDRLAQEIAQTARAQLTVDLTRYAELAHTTARIANPAGNVLDPDIDRQWRQRMPEVVRSAFDAVASDADMIAVLDARGVEIVRVVNPAIPPAPRTTTPRDESKAPYFTSAIALPLGRVHIQAPYLSIDSGRWVVGFSSPVFTLGRRVGVVHLEVPLSTIQNRLIHFLPSGYSLAVADTGGRVLVDSSAAAAGVMDLPTVGTVFPGLTFDPASVNVGVFRDWTIAGSTFRVYGQTVRTASDFPFELLVVGPGTPIVLDAIRRFDIAISAVAFLVLVSVGTFIAQRTAPPPTFRRRKRWKRTVRGSAIVGLTLLAMIVGIVAGRPFAVIASVVVGAVLVGIWLWKSSTVTARSGSLSIPHLPTPPSDRNAANWTPRDQVTGLLDRTILTDKLERAIEAANVSGATVGLLIIDLDDFKLINDSFGYDAGDTLLKLASERLNRRSGFPGTVARLGGDEFVVLMERIGHLDDLVRLADKVKTALNAPFLVEGRAIHLTASIGVTTSRLSPGDAGSMLRDAAYAVSNARTHGRGNRSVFDPSMSIDSRERLTLAAELRQALDRGELQLHFQPIVHVETGRLAALDALVRWKHPQLGLMYPRRFLAIAEEMGLMSPLGKWVLEEACRAASKWQLAHRGDEPVAVAVNVTAFQVRSATFVAEVVEAIADSGLNPELLTLELSDSFPLDSIDENAAKLVELRRLGIRITIDRFDLGNASLEYVRRLPVDAIKVNRTFAQSAVDDSKSAIIARAVLSTVQALGLQVIGLDVENAEQFGALITLGCEFAQGTWLGAPAPLSDLMVAYADGSADAKASTPDPIVRARSAA